MAHPIHQANERSIFGELTRDEFYQKHGILHQESFILNLQNMRIFTQSWRPANKAEPQLRGLVAMIHGYASESSWLFQLTAVAIAKQGFLAVSLDLRGHGRSEGPRTHLSSVNPAVSDCIQVFDAARSTHPSLPAFLYGESMGGAIAMLIALRQNNAWAGLVLNGAMCGVSAKFKPIWPLEEFLPLAAFMVPRWRVIFTKSLVEKSYKEKWKRKLARNSPTGRGVDHATFSTALEMTRVVVELERRCGELEVPLLMVHGRDDSVCDSESAESVYEMAGSKDKTLKILEGSWHQLVAEPEETVELGFGIIFSWLRERTAKRVGGQQWI